MKSRSQQSRLTATTTLMCLLGCLTSFSLLAGCQPKGTQVVTTSPSKNNLPAESEHTEAPKKSEPKKSEPKKKISESWQLKFINRAKERGLNFRYDNGSQGKSIMPETIGGGIGCLDMDRNGAIDFCFVQGGTLDTGKRREGEIPGLYINDGQGNFRNVADMAGMQQTGYGQGIAIGDIDDDGFEDIYLTTFGENTFLRNMGDGTFRDETERANLKVGVGVPPRHLRISTETNSSISM